MKYYSELIKFDNFKDRFEYLKLNGMVGSETFGYERYLNQVLYKSYEWKKIRQQVILRDNGCDLGVEGFEIPIKDILIHHINPITVQDIVDRNPIIFDLDNLITTRHKTHNAIHYSDATMIFTGLVERTKDDTRLW